MEPTLQTVEQKADAELNQVVDKVAVSISARLQRYNKTLITLVGAGLTVAAPYFGGNQAFQIVLAVATVLGVYHVPNGGK
jgi:hypothetical protein